MSFDGVHDKDLPLKLRMMNLLWNLGWFVRPNVKLHQYREGERTNIQFTDIDVLAIKILPLQNPITAICSAKSGHESDSSQIFWLSGVKSYFGASFAYYLRSKASLLRAKPLCEKLNIIALNEEQLGIIEERFLIRPQTSQYFNPRIYKQISQYFRELKDKKRTLYNYIIERFWIDPPNNQLLRIITAIRDVNTLSLSSNCKIYIKYYLTSLLALPLFQVAHLLVRIPTNMIRAEFDTALMGGELARLEKEKVLKACKLFIKELIKEAKLPGEAVKNGDAFLDQLFKLDYFGDLSDLLIRMVEQYNQSIFMPRMIDVLSYQIARKPSSIPNIQNATVPDLPKSQWEYAAKLTKDILIFVQRIGGFERSEIKI